MPDYTLLSNMAAQQVQMERRIVQLETAVAEAHEMAVRGEHGWHIQHRLGQVLRTEDNANV
jgi:hypothetical protein